MKKVFTLCLALISLNSFSQLVKLEEGKRIDIGKAKRGGVVLAELYYKVSNSDTTYYLEFDDAANGRGEKQKSVAFAAVGNTFESLYNVLNESLGQPKGTKNSFELGSTKVVLKTDKMLGTPFVSFYVDEAYFSVTEKELKKLFGR